MTLGEHVFSLLLRAYPAAFRKRYRADLLAFFRADRADPRYGPGIRGFLSFWYKTLIDLLRTAAYERVASVRRFFTRGSRGGGARPDREPSEESLRMETFIQDLRFALRTLLKHPGFTLVAVLTLALGIGTNSAIFSIVNGVLLRELPYRDADRIVALWGRDVDGTFGVSERERIRYREQTQLFEAFGSYFFQWGNLSAQDEAFRIPVANIDGDVLTALGVLPVLGRSFRAEEHRTGRTNVAL